MSRALYSALNIIMMDTPWFVLCCLPFMPFRKIERPTMALRIMLVSLGNAALVFAGMSAFPNGGMVTLNLFHTITYLPMFLVYYRSFDVGFAKIAYVFLLEQTIASMINNISAFFTRYVLGRVADVQYGFLLGFVTFLFILLLFPFLWRFFRGSLRMAMQLLSDKQILMMCAGLVLFYLLGTLYSFFSAIAGFEPLPDIVFGVLFTVTGISTNMITLKMGLDMADRNKLAAEVAAMEHRLNLQVERYSQLSESIKQARAIRHDVHHHLATIAGLAKRKDYERLMAYIPEYQEHLLHDDGAVLCENDAIDSLVRYYLARIRREDVRVDVKLTIPQKAGIPDADLCVVFGNLFENALQSLSQQQSTTKFLRARCETTGNQLVLTVDNSAPSTVLMEPGTGQLSVRTIAEKHDGTAQFECADGIYKASVLLTRAADERRA